MKIEPLNNKELFILCDLLNLPIVQIDRKDRMQFKHDGCYIINLQSWNEGGGSHWTALYRIGKTNIYFDSFGVAPPYDIIQQLHNQDICYFDDQIQDIESTACGYFCLVFLYVMHNNIQHGIDYAVSKIDNMFHDPEFNDSILSHILKVILSEK
tara:strand:- start:388 stop:849 length:462 start_codon:yes stop_codon:yes gene_type:complete